MFSILKLLKNIPFNYFKNIFAEDRVIMKVFYPEILLK